MDDRRLACLLAAAAAALFKTFSALSWLSTPSPSVAFKDVLLHGASAGAWLVASLKDAAAALPKPALAFALAPYALYWGAAAAAAVWLPLAVWSAMGPRLRRGLAAGALVAGLAVTARAGFETAVGGLSRARLAIAVATATRGAAYQFGRPSAARELSKVELEQAKRALRKRPLLSPDRARGPFDTVLKLGGGTANVTCAYDSRQGVERGLIRAD